MTLRKILGSAAILSVIGAGLWILKKLFWKDALK